MNNQVRGLGVIVGLLVVLGVLAQPVALRAQDDRQEAHKATVRYFFEHGYNQRNLAVVDAIHSPAPS